MSERPADPILAAALAAVEAGRPALLATIAAAKGSTPRVPGTRMLIGKDDVVGSVGGGELEFQIIARGRERLLSGRQESAREHFILGRDLRQCCGAALDIVLEPLSAEAAPWLRQVIAWDGTGQYWESVLAIGAASGARILRPLEAVPAEPGTAKLQKTDAGTILVETSGRPWPLLYLFGAGHVGKALVRLLGDLPVHVTWCDPRDGIFPDDIPGNVRLDAGEKTDELINSAPDDAYFLIMTHGHALDYEITEAVLRKGRFAFLGLIGSDSKKARFVQRFAEIGIAADSLVRLTSPIGIPGIKSKLPAAIAVAVAADLLVRWGAEYQATGVQKPG